MKIVLGFSGGVDSSVSAVLLKRAGHEVHGLYLDIAGEAARESAISTAEQISIPLEVRNISEELEQHVCRPVVNAYLSGETPNPCMLCNPAVNSKICLIMRIGSAPSVWLPATTRERKTECS